MRILVTSIGSLAGEAVINAFKSKGNYVMGCNMYPAEWIASASLVDEYVIVPAASEAKMYIETIVEICKTRMVDFVVPLTDPEVDLLSANQQELIEAGIQVCISSKNSIDICRDKFLFYEFFKNDKLVNVIPTFDAKVVNPKDLAFPIIVKPKRGRSSEGKSLINSSEEFACIRMFRNEYVVQPFLSGYVYVVDLLRNNRSGKSYTIHRKELLRTSNGAGLSVEVAHINELDTVARHIGEKLQINGCINLEFILNVDKFYLMDINPRFSAGIAFSLLTGYDTVNDHLSCFSNEEIIGEQRAYSPIIVTRKFIEVVTLNH